MIIICRGIPTPFNQFPKVYFKISYKLRLTIQFSLMSYKQTIYFYGIHHTYKQHLQLLNTYTIEFMLLFDI